MISPSTQSATERCVCCSEGHLLGKPIRVIDIHDAQDAQAAPFLVLEECPNTGNVPIAESSQTLQMNEAAGGG